LSIDGREMAPNVDSRRGASKADSGARRNDAQLVRQGIGRHGNNRSGLPRHGMTVPRHRG
jgi:hypothetical protein